MSSDECGAVRQNRSGTKVYTTPCRLPTGHDGYHIGFSRRDGTRLDWVYASDPRAQVGRTVATIHIPPAPDLSDEHLAEVLAQWTGEA